MNKQVKAIMEAFWDSHQQDRKYWHSDGVSDAFRELVNQLKLQYEIEEGVEDCWVIDVGDILRICDGLEGK